MTVDSNTSSGRGNDPEQIDLIELLLQLWRGKMTIIVAVIIAILLAVGYLMIAKEKWTSTAIITNLMPRRLPPIPMRSTSCMAGMPPNL
ncbi:regulator of length of O-antigen component of lipopolysaccharide chains [Salmonella enterica subsp. enterica]|uniref:Chain length determinant protein n=1 Tax=Salmonella enterica I TaxID=59201 RepID=A0A379W6C6_SALET|nr:regulator of length of O-antigen component of lipopolysaccharide chains [Salmonella enterica subsp. enterica]